MDVQGGQTEGLPDFPRPSAHRKIQPEPPLFPEDPALRMAVEDAERWGEEVLSDATRRILWNAIQRDKAPLRSYLGDARIGVRRGRCGRPAVGQIRSPSPSLAVSWPQA